MFNSFLNLKVNPFAETPDARFFYEAKQHSAVLDRLSQTLEKGNGFTMLTGEVGTGKTIVSRALIQQLEPVATSALLLFPALEGRDLFEAIAEEFGLALEPGLTTKGIINQLVEFLIANAKSGKKALLILDEAQNASINGLENIRMLSNFEQDSSKLLHILLVGQPELKTKLEKPVCRQINQRISAQLELEGLAHDEVAKYIRHRIEIAGGANFVSFKNEAVQAIYQLSAGLPRLINLQCQLALEYAAKNGNRVITKTDLIRALENGNVLKSHRSMPWRREVKLVQV